MPFRKKHKDVIKGMKYQDIFQRYEIKYLITREQKELLLRVMENYMQPDEYGQSLICNLYFDTPDYTLIRRSLEGPVYKEKLRVRSYGRARSDSQVFLELKKKYKGVVYKRRIDAREQSAMDYLLRSKTLMQQSQITEEIDYFKQMYPGLVPTVYLSYEREAFCGKTDEGLRITFDENILWRQEELSLCAQSYGRAILEPDSVLMEIKTASAIPLWLCGFLSEHSIFKTNFSKYGRAYTQMLQVEEGGRKYA